jgi:hypothetical protein
VGSVDPRAVGQGESRSRGRHHCDHTAPGSGV